MNNAEEFTSTELTLLKQCLTLAEEALADCDQPCGWILVNSNNEVIAKARNRVNELNKTAHPEIKQARWAADNLPNEERKKTRMFTTSEHCPASTAANRTRAMAPSLYSHAGYRLEQSV